jgi:hypothetical protein
MLGSHIMARQLLQQLLHSPTSPGLPQPAAILPFPQPFDLPDLPARAPSEGAVARATSHSHQHSHAPHCQLSVRPGHTQLLPLCLHAQPPCQHLLLICWIIAHKATRPLHQPCQHAACCAIRGTELTCMRRICQAPPPCIPLWQPPPGHQALAAPAPQVTWRHQQAAGHQRPCCAASGSTSPSCTSASASTAS